MNASIFSLVIKLKIYGDRLKLMDTGAISLLKQLVAGKGRYSADRREMVEDKKAATEVQLSILLYDYKNVLNF